MEQVGIAKHFVLATIALRQYRLDEVGDRVLPEVRGNITNFQTPLGRPVIEQRLDRLAQRELVLPRELEMFFEHGFSVCAGHISRFWTPCANHIVRLPVSVFISQRRSPRDKRGRSGRCPTRRGFTLGSGLHAHTSCPHRVWREDGNRWLLEGYAVPVGAFPHQDTETYIS